MTKLDPELDLEITRVIKAPRAAVWAAWTTPERFEKWWVPAPALCRVVAMDLRPGGGLVTQMSEGGGPFGPHLSASYLAVEQGRGLVFTNMLLEGWRPAEDPFVAMTAAVTLTDHDLGTHYRAVVKHKSPQERQRHAELGFHDGWGTVAAQLAALVEGRGR